MLKSEADKNGGTRRQHGAIGEVLSPSKCRGTPQNRIGSRGRRARDVNGDVDWKMPTARVLRAIRLVVPSHDVSGRLQVSSVQARYSSSPRSFSFAQQRFSLHDLRNDEIIGRGRTGVDVNGSRWRGQIKYARGSVSGSAISPSGGACAAGAVQTDPSGSAAGCLDFVMDGGDGRMNRQQPRDLRRQMCDTRAEVKIKC
jgi:hypothetical protein